MSDPTSERFRDLATVMTPAVQTPEFDELYRVGRRRHTRRTSAAAFAVVTVVALVVMVPAAAGYRLTDTLTRIGSEVARKTGDVPEYRGSGSGMIFVSPTAGYRYLSKCPNAPERCELTIDATSDGGRTWRDRSVPRLPLPEQGGANDPYLEVLGPRTLLLITGKQRQLSTDGGWHWAANAPQVTSPVDSVSRSDLLAANCPNDALCKRPQLVKIDRMTGAEAPLRTQPPAAALNFAVFRAADGSMWIPTREDTGQTGATVSHDGGKTWITREFAGLTTVSETMVNVVSWGGRTGYAVLTADPGARELPVLRTDDGGQTWRRLAAAQGLDPSSVMDVGALPDGRLAIGQQQPHLGTFVSSDGRTFERLASVPSLMSFQPFSGGVLAEKNGQGKGNPKQGYDTASGTQMYMTTDGKNWRALPWWDTDNG